MKKLIAIFLSVLLLAQPVLASSRSEDEMVVRVKNIFNITEEYDRFSVGEGTDEFGNTLIEYSWSDDELGYINVQINPNGDVINYNKSAIAQPQKGALGTVKEAENIATALLNKMDPNLLKEYEFERSLNFVDPRSNQVTLYLQRRVNDIKVNNDTINIGIDLNKKEVASFYRYKEYINKDSSDFSDPAGAIDLEKAKTSFKEKIGLKKAFFIRYKTDKPREKEAIPVYAIVNPNLEIDALTGEVREKYHIFSTHGALGESADSASIKEESASLTPIESEELEKSKSLKTSKEAEAAANEVSSTSGYKLESAQIYKSEDDIYIWRLNYSNSAAYKSFDLNAEDLSLIGFSDYTNEDYTDAPANRERALELAEAFIRRVSPQSVDVLDFENPNIIESSNSTTINYLRYEGEFYYLNNGVSISISNSSDKVTSFYKVMDNMDFDKGTADIGLDKAYDILFNTIGYGLFYKLDKDRDIILVYDVDNLYNSYISMADGQIVTAWQGQDQEPIIYEDIEESKYKDQIAQLAEFRIGFPNSKLKPKEDITQQDVVFLLYRLNGSIGPYNEEGINNAYDYATGYGNILDKSEIDKESKVTIGDYYRLLFKSQGLQILENYNPIIFDKGVFSDTEKMKKENVPYVYSAYALGFFNTKATNSQENITREEALYHISQLLNKQDIMSNVN